MTARQATQAQDWLTNHCNGSGQHSGPREVRTYPLGGGGNLILCMHCWAHENRYRFNMGREYKRPQDWPQVDWNTAKVYATEEGGVNER